MPSCLTTFAKQLRSNSTDLERLLWSRLRANRLTGFKFRRQLPIGPYIVDFACCEARLIVELDGGQHAETVLQDASRDDWLGEQGFRVLRFWNNDVLENLDGVLMRILEHLSPSPQPSPIKGEGAGARTASLGALLIDDGANTPLPSWERGWGEGENKPRDQAT
jgi:very-short-patch-repair endonuclease